MDIGRLVSWGIFAALAYGGYKYFSTGDITIMPPPPETVLTLAKQANTKLEHNQHISAGKPCERIRGGRIKQGVYSCEISIYNRRASEGKPIGSYAILVEKRNGQWQLTK